MAFRNRQLGKPGYGTAARGMALLIVARSVRISQLAFAVSTV